MTPDGPLTQNDVMLTGFHDDQIYELTCKGKPSHTTVMILANHKYDVLFQWAAHAINDGYYRDAVVTFTSSLERFYEHAIQCMTTEPERVSIPFADSWKRVARQSERQLGAFIFLWLKEFGTAAPLLTDDQYGFRNKVVHDGKIPTRGEATEYGNTVLHIIRAAKKQLKQRFGQRIYERPRENMERFDALTANGEKLRMSLMEGTILGENELNDDSVTLGHYLSSLAHVQKLREQFSA
jgi:hypothetical protein